MYVEQRRGPFRTGERRPVSVSNPDMNIDSARPRLRTVNMQEFDLYRKRDRTEPLSFSDPANRRSHVTEQDSGKGGCSPVSDTQLLAHDSYAVSPHHSLAPDEPPTLVSQSERVGDGVQLFAFIPPKPKGPRVPRQEGRVGVRHVLPDGEKSAPSMRRRCGMFPSDLNVTPSMSPARGSSPPLR